MAFLSVIGFRHIYAICPWWTDQNSGFFSLTAVNDLLSFDIFLFGVFSCGLTIVLWEFVCFRFFIFIFLYEGVFFRFAFVVLILTHFKSLAHAFYLHTFTPTPTYTHTHIYKRRSHYLHLFPLLSHYLFLTFSRSALKAFVRFRFLFCIFVSRAICSYLLFCITLSQIQVFMYTAHISLSWAYKVRTTSISRIVTWSILLFFVIK